jgi:hypothetical protein
MVLLLLLLLLIQSCGSLFQSLLDVRSFGN